MLELTTLLQQSIRLDRDITARQQIHWRPQERLQNAMVSLDVELAEMANMWMPWISFFLFQPFNSGHI